MSDEGPNERDEWTTNGRNILSPERLSRIRNILKDGGPVIVEHWFYYGSRSPDRLVIDDYDEFVAYLNANAKPGDAIHVWDFSQVCTDMNSVTYGKFPDQQGQVPRGGAY